MSGLNGFKTPFGRPPRAGVGKGPESVPPWEPNADQLSALGSSLLDNPAADELAIARAWKLQVHQDRPQFGQPNQGGAESMVPDGASYHEVDDWSTRVIAAAERPGNS